MLTPERCTFSLRHTRFRVNAWGAVGGNMAWCGGLGSSLRRRSNLPFKRHVELCSMKTFVECRCDEVEEQLDTTCQHMQQLKGCGWV